MASWQTSAGHYSVILNLQYKNRDNQEINWHQKKWQAIGIGIYYGYVNVWFGDAADPAGPPLPGISPSGPPSVETDPEPKRPTGLDWANIRLSDEEQYLYDLVMEYRYTRSLPAIPLSRNLSYVAQLHVRDLHHHRPNRGPCDFYSWSGQGPWTPGCFTGKVEEGPIIWEKPRELTAYPGDGFEICFSLGHNIPATAAEAWANWQDHPESLDMFLAQGGWEDMNWRAIGIGIYQGYVSVWFGLEPDPDRL